MIFLATIISTLMLSFSQTEQDTLSLVVEKQDKLLVGEKTKWQVVSGNEYSDYLYRFSIESEYEEKRIVSDFYSGNEFVWSTLDEGVYTVEATVYNTKSEAVTVLQERLAVHTRIQDFPKVSEISHPLMALYSVPAGNPRQSVRIQFRPKSGGRYSYTHEKTLNLDRSANFYIAGMRENTEYEMRHEILDEENRVVESGAPMFFTTGKGEYELPESFTRVDHMDHMSIADPFLLQVPSGSESTIPPFATDMDGNLAWYASRLHETITQVNSGGRYLSIDWMDYKPIGYRDVVQESDFSGQVIRRVTLDRLNEQLRSMGKSPIQRIHHEAILLPNGFVAVFGSRIQQEELPFSRAHVRSPTFVSDLIVVLDNDFQVSWVWDASDYLDTNRRLDLEDLPVDTANPFSLDNPAHDWTRSNSIDYDVDDGSLIVSVRNQNWIVKIAYEDGKGDGRIIWKLGREGDFKLNAEGSMPWFSNQHSARYLGNGQILVFDNGNTRVSESEEPFSRGQVYLIDENTMEATLIYNICLREFSPFFGSAQVLSNGNLHFNAGYIQKNETNYDEIDLPDSPRAISYEITPSGEIAYSMQVESNMYRSYRLQSFYSPPIRLPLSKTAPAPPIQHSIDHWMGLSKDEIPNLKALPYL